MTLESDQPLIIGHRGAAGLAPENTEAAFQAGVSLGVDAVEFDVQFTADGYPVVFHDETLQRMAGVPARISGCTEAALQGFDVGFLHGPEYRGERIPGVGRVAELVPAPIELHVEIKDYEPVSGSLLRRLFEVLEASAAMERSIFSSPHEETLTAVRNLRPHARTALLLFGDVKSPADAVRRAAFIGCWSVHPNHRLVDSDLVDLCHRHRMKVLTFTVNERGTMRDLRQMGVDGFFTDYPDRLREAES